MLTAMSYSKLRRFSLVCVALGAATGITAALYAWLVRGEFESMTLVASLGALAAGFPVWRAAGDSSFGCPPTD